MRDEHNRGSVGQIGGGWEALRTLGFGFVRVFREGEFIVFVVDDDTELWALGTGCFYVLDSIVLLID